MKKFLILSAIVGLAGIGVGVARQQEPATVEAATVDATSSTTVTTLPSAATSSPTTVRKTAAKATSTPTTARRVSAPTALTPTTTSQAIAAPTTATTMAPTTTTRSGPAPTCTLTAEKASIAYGEPQVLHLTSSLPNTPMKATAIYPGSGGAQGEVVVSPKFEVHSATTDGNGADTWTTGRPYLSSPGTVRVSVNFYPVGAKQIGSLCSTSFQAV